MVTIRYAAGHLATSFVPVASAVMPCKKPGLQNVLFLAGGSKE